MAETGSVSFLFEHMGVIIIEGHGLTEEEVLEYVIESGSDDYEQDDEHIFIIKSARDNFHQALVKITRSLENTEWKIIESELRYVPKDMVELNKEKTEAMLQLVENLEANDDVQNVYSNLDETIIDAE